MKKHTHFGFTVLFTLFAMSQTFATSIVTNESKALDEQDRNPSAATTWIDISRLAIAASQDWDLAIIRDGKTGLFLISAIYRGDLNAVDAPEAGHLAWSMMLTLDRNGIWSEHQSWQWSPGLLPLEIRSTVAGFEVEYVDIHTLEINRVFLGEDAWQAQCDPATNPNCVPCDPLIHGNCPPCNPITDPTCDPAYVIQPEDLPEGSGS